MTEGLSQPNLKLRLEDVTAKYPKTLAISRIRGMLWDEYARLEENPKYKKNRLTPPQMLV